VKCCDTKATIRVKASNQIERLKTLLSHHASFPVTRHLSFSWDGKELDENKCFADYGIPSGAQLNLGTASSIPILFATFQFPPITFEVNLVTAENHKHKIPIRTNETLKDFREAVYLRYSVPQSKVTPVLDGHKLVGESTSLNDLGFVPGCAIHAGD
jgi:hypothetical protein